MDTGQESELVTGYPSNTYPNNAFNLRNSNQQSVKSKQTTKR